jgi:hypothetical protein
MTDRMIKISFVMTLTCAVHFSLPAISAPLKTEAEALAMFENPVVQDCVKCIWKIAQYGRLRSEGAAYIADFGSQRRCYVWPRTNEDRRQTINISFGPNTTSILHTHPNDSVRYPSSGDIETAKKTGYPNFVISKDRISGYIPAIHENVTIVRGKAFEQYVAGAEAIEGCPLNGGSFMPNNP